MLGLPDGTADLDLVRRLERASLRAVPAEEEWHAGGWTCRWGGEGRIGRVASACVSPDHLGTPSPVGEVVASYRARGRKALLRLTPLAPEDLVAAATRATTTGRQPVEVMTADLAGQPSGPERHDVALQPDPSPAWMSTYVAQQAPGEGEARLSLALRAPRRRRFATVQDPNGRVLGIGLCVLEGGLLGIFDVLTVPAARRRGVATAVVAALREWGAGVGADTVYLQVSSGNSPALRLYEEMGFTTAYRYRYWFPDPDGRYATSIGP